MKLKCKHCEKLLTTDLYPVKVIENNSGYYTNLKDIYDKDEPVYEYDFEDEEKEELVGYTYGNMKKGIFYLIKAERSWNNKWDEDRPAQIIKKTPTQIVVGQGSILNDIIPTFKSGHGCCNYSMGEVLYCECGNKLGGMYLDCYESKHINFIENNVVRFYK